jgi:hypothetical protein
VGGRGPGLGAIALRSTTGDAATWPVLAPLSGALGLRSGLDPFPGSAADVLVGWRTR